MTRPGPGRARVLALVAALAFAVVERAGAAATPPAADELLRKLEAASQGVTTLAGEFTQRNRVKLFKQELTSSGRLFFRKPRQVRWEYRAPDASTLILDGERATLSTPGAAPQVFDLTRDATMRAVIDQLLLWLGPGSPATASKVHTDYQVTAGGSAATPTLTLTPRETSPIARAFSRVELRLDGKSWLLRSILLIERSGDEKEIVFTRLERNAALPADAFRSAN